MSRPRILRLLRIAFSVVCGIACLLLIGLWLRSLNRIDRIQLRYQAPKAIDISTLPGQVLVAMIVEQPIVIPATQSYSSYKIWPPWFRTMRLINSDGTTWNFGVWTQPNYAGVHIPIWFLILLSIAFAVGAWAPLRFSLRTLLIATALIAVVLGIVAVANR